MSNIAPAIRSILAGDSGVTDIVGTDPVRIYWVNRRQNVTSASIVIERIVTDRELTFGGATGYLNGTMQVHCFATTYELVNNLTAAVQAALHAFTGVIAGTTVDFIKITGDNDINNDPAEGRNQQQIYGVTLEAAYQIKES